MLRFVNVFFQEKNLFKKLKKREEHGMKFESPPVKLMRMNKWIMI